MDEEVAPYVKQAWRLSEADKTQCATVHVLERNNRKDPIRERMLFQRHVSSYGPSQVTLFQAGPVPYTNSFADAQGFWKSKQVLPKASDNTGWATGWTEDAFEVTTPFERAVLNNIDKDYMSDAFSKTLKNAKIPNPSKCNPDFPELLLYRLGAASESTGPHCVLLRAPEMGLQPQMAKEIFVAALRSFAGMEVEYYASGAGGAANSNLAENRPGCAHEAAGSFFIGSKDGKKPAVLGFKLNGPASGDDLLKYRGSNIDGDNGAKPATLNSVLQGQKEFRDVKVAASAGSQTLKAAMSAFVTAAGGEVTTSEDAFLGKPDKEAADAVGSVGANMEDSWVIAAYDEIQSKADNAFKDGYPKLVGSPVVLRSDADPYNVESWVDAYNAWAQSVTEMKQGDLVEILMWGLTMNVDNTPEVMCWNKGAKAFVTGTGSNPAPGAFVPGQAKGSKTRDCVINGIHTETAADIWKDGLEDIEKKGKVLKPTFEKAIDAAVVACKKAKTAVFDKVDAYAGTSDITSDAEIKGLVEKFVNAFAALIQTAQTGSGGTSTYKATNTIPVWIRSKWPVPDTALPLLHLCPFDGEAVDRLFYKSSNQPLMVRVAQVTMAGALDRDNRARFGTEFPMAYWAAKPKAAELLKETCDLTDASSFGGAVCSGPSCQLQQTRFLEISSRLSRGMSFLEIQEDLAVSDSDMAFAQCCHDTGNFAHEVEAQLGMLRTN